MGKIAFKVFEGPPTGSYLEELGKGDGMDKPLKAMIRLSLGFQGVFLENRHQLFEDRVPIRQEIRNNLKKIMSDPIEGLKKASGNRRAIPGRRSQGGGGRIGNVSEIKGGD